MPDRHLGRLTAVAMLLPLLLGTAMEVAGQADPPPPPPPAADAGVPTALAGLPPLPPMPPTPRTQATPPGDVAPTPPASAMAPVPPADVEATRLEIRYAEYGALQEVDGEAMYRAAREALANSQYQQASRLFARLRRDYPSSALVGDSYYYQAFALYRYGDRQNEAAARAAYEEAAALLAVQAEEHREAATRRDAAELHVRVESALAGAGDRAARAAVQERAQEACGDEESSIRAMALSALINMDSERAIPMLREIVTNRDECLGEFRAQAIFMLAQHEPDQIVDVLLDVIENDPDPEVREAAVFWLSEADSPAATDALLAIVQSADEEEMLEGALFALSQKDDARAKDALRALVRRQDAPMEARAQALFWLAESAETELPFLREIYGQLDDPELREHVVFAAGQVEGQAATDFLREIATDPTADREARGHAVFWLGQRGATVSDLKAIYDANPDRELREAVLMGVGQMDSSEAVDLLMDIARSDADADLREMAVFWLGQSDDPRVPAFLLEIIGR